MALSPAAPPPALLEAIRKSTSAWQDDLQALFHHAKDRFGDVVWEPVDENNEKQPGAEEVWGHKAIVYARAPPSFQARYFSFKPAPPTSPYPYSSSPTPSFPAQSALSLSLGLDYTSPSRSPSPFRAPSPSPSTQTGAILRLPTSINPVLFSNELEYLYTGKGFGEAFEFLFDASEGWEEGDGEDVRMDKLRKDLVFMWRSRLYSDVRIALTGNFSSTNHENATAIFSSHRFMLVSRSPYFNTQLLGWGVTPKPDEPLTITLPSPPFTPASLHFTLGFIYTGTLIFSHRSFDLDTAFHIMRSATYLSLDALYDEIQARIVQEMLHGLFHAFLEFAEYERITGGKWGTGGCRCRQCARRAPRVLEFAMQDDVKNSHLERGARRALVGLYGDGWCTPEFAHLPPKTREALVKGLGKRTTPMNIFPLIFATQKALAKLDTIIDPWAETCREMIYNARKVIDDVLCSQAVECFEQSEWLDIMEADGVKFEDGERVEQVMEAIRRGMNEKNAAILYQTLVSSILLRPHATETEETMLSPTSQIRVQVEQARMDVVRWLRRRWLGVKQEGGFDSLEPWAAKEISHEIEVSVEDLFSPMTTSGTPRGVKGGLRAVNRDDSDTVSMQSLRTDTLKHNVSKQGHDTVKSSAASVRSVARSTRSTASRLTVPVKSPRRIASPSDLRPDSKLTPPVLSSSLSISTVDSDVTNSVSTSQMDSTSSSQKPRSPSINSTTNGTPRPKSVAPSVKSTRSTRSQATTIRKTNPGPSHLRPPHTPSRPNSTQSTTSDASTTFQTAKSDMPSSSGSRTRRGSVTSTFSTASARSTATSTPKVVKSRPPSSVANQSSSASIKVKRPAPPDPTRLSPLVRKTPSSTSLRSTTSTTSTASKKVVLKKPSSVPSTPISQSRGSDRQLRAEPSKSTASVRSSPRQTSIVVSHEKQASVVSSDSTNTVKDFLKRKKSNDTVTGLPPAEVTAPSDEGPRGATLDVGIPCVISWKKARFRGFARYIGELEGEAGPWVGVEVPVGDSWSGERVDGQSWHDGTWGGIKYFDVGGTADWEYGDERLTRRRRADWISGMIKDSRGSLKREGDQLSIDRAKRMRSVSPAVSDISNSESRGLFVRPQHVLYVMDAVESEM